MHIALTSPLSPTANTKEILTALLASRGYSTLASQSAFLNTPALTLDYIYQESGIKQTDLATAQSLLDSHLAANHDLCVFGDYDADGVTATAVLYLALERYARKQGSTSRILPFIPDRHRHGYGLSDLAVSEVISGEAFSSTKFHPFHPQLILTVDTGIVAHQGIQAFRDAGIAVILTDHHLPNDAGNPPADSLIHSVTTSGAGVAWVLASHLLGETTSFLDLATIGVIADMMPLVGFNRTLVKHGLTELGKTKNQGIIALRTRMGIPPRPLTTYDISFGIAPRINAAGRIYSPLDALRLLCTTDPALATELASTIESHNTNRQLLTDQALTHALSQPHPHKLIALAGDYHEGVIGLVAGKLVEKEYKPAFVISQGGEVSKGSARSIPGFNITAFLRSLSTPFLGLGGHEAAAGFSLASAHVPALLAELYTKGDLLLTDALLARRHVADLPLTLAQTTLELARLLQSLEPFGLGNPKPRFLFESLRVLEDRPLGEGGKHHKLTLEQGGTTRTLLIFNSPHSHPLTSLEQLIATVDVNVWNNRESLQLTAAYVEP